MAAIKIMLFSLVIAAYCQNNQKNTNTLWVKWAGWTLILAVQHSTGSHLQKMRSHGPAYCLT